MQVTDADAAKAKVTAERENSRTLDRARAAAVEVHLSPACQHPGPELKMCLAVGA
jgi:hypothetical protein